MPSAMPEFEMPPERSGAATSPASATAPGMPDASSPGPSLSADGRSARTASRRRLIAGAILAALAVIGGSAGAITQAVQRGAEEAATVALSAAALEYLGAIAEGRGDAATALVPVDGPAPLLGDAALAAAVRIQQLGVEASSSTAMPRPWWSSSAQASAASSGAWTRCATTMPGG